MWNDGLFNLHTTFLPSTWNKNSAKQLQNVVIAVMKDLKVGYHMKEIVWTGRISDNRSFGDP